MAVGMDRGNSIWLQMGEVRGQRAKKRKETRYALPVHMYHTRRKMMTVIPRDTATMMKMIQPLTWKPRLSLMKRRTSRGGWKRRVGG